MSSSGGGVRFAHTVFAVREDEEDGRQPEFLDQPFKLNALYHPSSSVLFRLSVVSAQSTSNKTILYLHITPDRIASLRHTTCDTNDTSDESPPCLERVRQRLGAKRLVTRLQLRLHNGFHCQLIAPTGLTRDEAQAPDNPARHTFALATSLATASTFSLYFPHNVLRVATFQAFAEAVRQFPNLTAAQRQSYERVVDLRRLYYGKGGTVVTPEEVPEKVPEKIQSSPLHDGQDNRATTPATSESCGSTVAFDIVPRDQASPPPQYDEHGNNGRQPKDQPRAKSAVTAFVDGSLGGDDDLPPYRHSEGQHNNAWNVSKRGLHFGSEETDIHPSSKRVYSKRTFTTIYTTTMDDERPGENSKSPLADLERSQSRLTTLLEQQRQQILQLQADVEELKKRNRELEARHDDVEDSCCDLGNRQTETEETVESLLIHTGELDDECEKLGKHMPDICDDVEEWAKDNLGGVMQEHMSKWFEENMAETVNGYINDKVADKLAVTKARMRRALQD
ncbi:hypothetical protein CFIO01_13061 [Colletotrichum fioriniae PJ7]|uniref:Uncharacterized protein n=1 Tax=Colletotrichum fioriniae PJ7 TaxID=1445577 RepID=A0A010Q458_9PEZI|nr:hypothetical protein CFIO01_13061 [Colletotrichum fioriniae PJ7]